VAVEQEGVRRWLARGGDPSRRDEFEKGRRIRADFAGLIQKHRARLDALYRARMAPEAMRDAKRWILAELQSEYRSLKAGWGGFDGYDPWFAYPLNNAQLASVAVYSQWVGAFEALLARENASLPRFYLAVRQLAELPKAERDAQLRTLAARVAGI
jgi:predicted aminopeptidase